jgi:hypothetical protein
MTGLAFRRWKLAGLTLIAATAATMLADADAFAQRFRDRDFHGRDFRRFSVEERRIWRSGRWFHEFHDGRLGWWWVADGFWYYYPQPIYPFPTYVGAEVVVNAPPPYPPYDGPPSYDAPQPYGAVPPAPPPQAAASWYYCDNPQGYYPYVQNCSVQWRAVPSAPPGYGAAPPPPAAR